MPLPILDTETFRRDLAGLSDPRVAHDASAPKEELRAAAVELCVVLAELFNRDKLDPITLWSRITSGIAVACSRVDDGDLEALSCIALDHVQADGTRVACSDRYAVWIRDYATKPAEWRLALVSHIDRLGYVVVALGRQAWQAHKGASNG